MLLLDVATTSLDVGGTSSRLSKVAHIADLLRRAAADPDEVAIVVSWLSGELRQRQIGVGWAALRSRPPPAPHPALTVAAVDASFSEIGAVSGKGSQARRAQLITGLFAASTDIEQTFLLRLLGGELRQGAPAGIMADAVAKAAGLPVAAVQRAAMLGGDLPGVAAAAMGGGARALEAFALRVGRPVGPMLAQTATGVADALERHGGTTIFEAKLDGARVQIHRSGDQVTVYTRSLDDVTARLPEVVEATLALPVRDLIADGEAIALRADNSPHRFQVTASRFGRSVDVAEARAAQPLSVFFFDILHRDGADLLARRPPSGWPPWTRWCRPRSGSIGSPPQTPTRRPGSWRRRSPPVTRASWPRRRRRRIRQAAAARAGSRSSRCTRWTWWCWRWSGDRGADAASSPTSTWGRATPPPPNS